MKDHLKRNLLLGLALTAVIAGVVIAATSSRSHHHHATKTQRGAGSSGRAPGDVQLAAGYLGISRAELRRRLRTGESMAEVANSMPGKSASGLIAELLAPRSAQVKSRNASSTTQQEALERARSQVIAETARRGGRSRLVPTAAAYLGLGEPALRAKLRSGESMAQVASAQHRSSADLIAALVAVEERRLKTALAEHAITSAHEKAALSGLHTRLQHEVEQHLALRPG